MLLGLTFVLLATLALFESWRNWRLRTRRDVDIFDLQDLVEGMARREKSERARERSALRRAVEADREPPPVNDGAPADRPIGGVVRKEIELNAFSPTRPARRA